MIELLEALCVRFGGLAKGKNFYSASEAERSARFHLVSIMASFVYAPGKSFTDLMSDNASADVVAAYRRKPAYGVPQERWERHVDAAVELLRAQGDREVRLLCEVQMVLPDACEVRHKMHEVYKVCCLRIASRRC